MLVIQKKPKDKFYMYVDGKIISVSINEVVGPYKVSVGVNAPMEVKIFMDKEKLLNNLSITAMGLSLCSI